MTSPLKVPVGPEQPNVGRSDDGRLPGASGTGWDERSMGFLWQFSMLREDSQKQRRSLNPEEEEKDHISSPAPGSTEPGEFQDKEFGTSMNDFKAIFGGGQRKNVPKGQTLVLLRNAQGALDALFQPDPTKPMQWMGRVTDERISRLVWLNYLAGKKTGGVTVVVELPTPESRDNHHQIDHNYFGPAGKEDPATPVMDAALRAVTEEFLTEQLK